MIRHLTFLSLISYVVFWLHGEQQRGRFRSVDERFLDFLVTNAREHFAPDLAQPHNVVFVRIAEADKATYAAWPPPPIDLQLMVKAIAAHAPLALVIDAPLSWGEPAPDFIPELADALLPLPHVIAGIDVSTGSGTLADGPALQRLPQITNLNDESHALLIATEVKAAPAAAIASKVELGCHSSADPEQLAMAYRVAQRVVPSMLLQALTAVTNTPFSQQRLSTGGGAGLHLGDGVYVPLDERACLKLANSSASAQMPTIDALDLMTPTLAGDESSDLTKALGTGKVIVLGLDKAAPLARGITEALARPRIRELLGWQQWSIWGAAALLGMHLLHRPRAKALSRMLLLLFLALTTSYLAFQNNLTWCPPAIPAMIIAVSGVFARMFGKPVNTASTNGMEEAQSE